MANIKTQSCDICGIHRAPSNHWFKVFRVDRGLLILEWESAGPEGDARPSENADAHICGHAHLVEWISKEFFGKANDQ